MSTRDGSSEGQSTVPAQAGTAGSNGHGTFTLDAAGNWTYSAADSQAAIQQLGAGQTLTRSEERRVGKECRSQLVTEPNNGTNDTPVRGGAATGSETD